MTRFRVQAVVARLGGRAFRGERRFARTPAGGALVVGGLIVFTVALWLVIKVLPEQLAATRGINDPSKHAEEIGRTRTAILASLAGVLAAIGAYYTHRTFDLNRQGHELNRQGQITERFTRAVDQLGNPSLDVRLGGIYALERLARESRDDQARSSRSLPLTSVSTPGRVSRSCPKARTNHQSSKSASQPTCKPR